MSTVFGLAGNYITVEKSLALLPVSRDKSPVIKEIDELLNTVEEYRNTYSGYFYDVKSDEKNKRLEVLPTAGSMEITYNKIQKKEWAMRINVLTGLTDLVLLLEKTEGCEQIASAAPAIFNLRETPSGSFNWESDVHCLSIGALVPDISGWTQGKPSDNKEYLIDSLIRDAL